MRAYGTTFKMMALVALSAIMFAALATVAVAGPSTATMMIADQYKNPTVVQDLRNLADLDISAIQQAETPADGPTASDPTDGDLSGEPEAQPAEPEGDAGDDGSENHDGDAGDDGSDDGDDAVVPPDAGDDAPVPADAGDDASHASTTTPGSAAATQTAKPPTHKPQRNRLAYTGSDQVMYLLGGVLIIMAATGIFFLGRGTKQDQQQ